MSNKMKWLALIAVVVAAAFLMKPKDEAPVAANTPVEVELTKADSDRIHQQVIDDLGDMPRRVDSLKKADPAKYDDEYRAEHGL